MYSLWIDGRSKDGKVDKYGLVTAVRLQPPRSHRYALEQASFVGARTSLISSGNFPTPCPLGVVSHRPAMLTGNWGLLSVTESRQFGPLRLRRVMNGPVLG